MSGRLQRKQSGASKSRNNSETMSDDAMAGTSTGGLEGGYPGNPGFSHEYPDASVDGADPHTPDRAMAMGRANAHATSAVDEKTSLLEAAQSNKAITGAPAGQLESCRSSHQALRLLTIGHTPTPSASHEIVL